MRCGGSGGRPGSKSKTKTKTKCGVLWPIIIPYTYTIDDALLRHFFNTFAASTSSRLVICSCLGILKAGEEEEQEGWYGQRRTRTKAITS